MAEPELGDLVRVDRDVARAVAALERWRGDVARDPEAYADDEPLADLRYVTVKSTWEKLGQSPPPGGEAPLREALRRWVHVLLQARVGRGDDLARARAEAAPRGRLEGERPRQISWREAWRGVVASAKPAEARLWLRAASETAPPVAEASRARGSRRLEVARRLGLAHPWEVDAPAPRSTLRAAAGRLLDATEDLSAMVRREAVGPDGDAAAVLHAAMAREASDGWPARASARWLEATFAGGRGLPVELPELPPALGAASFARALYAFGFALRVAAGRGSAPFALARDPAFVGAHRLGFLFGALAADPELYVRALGVGRRRALAQARTLARTALLEARVHAARALVGSGDGPAPADLSDELGARLFGSPMDARLRGAWPAARDDEPARLIALLQAQGLRDSMRARFDADWFHNPRAWSHLRGLGDTPAREPVDDATLVPGADGLARAFEEALG